MDHEAIRKAYPTVITIDDDSNAILDKDGATVTVEQLKIDEARVTLNAEYEATKYKEQRRLEYPDPGTQFDYIYHHGIDKWKTDIVDPVKAKYPKPN